MTVSIDTRVKMDIPSLIPVSYTTPRGVFNIGEYKKQRDSLDGTGRNCDPTEKDYGIVKFYGLDEQFARRVAGKFNKNVVLVLAGEMGAGKSMALLSLALGISRWLSAILGGSPSKYFTFDNVAIIDPVSLSEKLENLKKHNIYILDDFSPGYDARQALSKNNITTSHILTTCRTTNNVILCSGVHGSMLDVNLHRLSMWYAEVSEEHHSEGVTFIKVLKVVQMFREGKIRRVYQTKQNVSAIRYYATMPPKELKDKYDIVRDKASRDIAQKRSKDVAAAAIKALEPRGKPGNKDRFSPDEFTKFMDVFVKEHKPTTHETVAETLGTDRTTLWRYMKKYGYAAERIPKSKQCIIIKE